MKNNILIGVAMLFLTGCNLFGSEPYTSPTPVEVRTVEVKPQLLQPARPQELRFEDIRWYVITEKNLDEKIAEVKKLQGDEFVVYAMTPHDYENISYNLQENRRYIRQSLEIVVYYEESTTPETTEE